MTRVAIVALLLPLVAQAGAPHAPRKKVVFVNSYHRGFEWSDGEEAGATEVLQANGVVVTTFYMDTKRHLDDRHARDMARRAKELIEAERPDLVIAADDAAVEHVLAAHFRDAPLPFVFCGVNWDASRYGLPYRNATGIVEVNLTKPLVQTLRRYARGDRIGFLSGESDAGHRDLAAYRDLLGITFAAQAFVTTMADWKASYARLQDEVDVLVVYGHPGVRDWDEAEAIAWTLARGKIPSGTIQDYMARVVDLAMAKVPREQGAWAARAALAILGGAAPASIPVAQNRQARLLVNAKHAEKVGITFDAELLRTAQPVE
jgi:ABC-type uncharacterized transport system substrate-binding protein